MAENRLESDSMGSMPVPADALYGASTQRAVLNFPVSGRPLPRQLIRALGLVKAAAAKANLQLGRLSPENAQLLEAAAAEIVEGKWDAHFPVDIFQTGSGTSSNMNVNEVLANRCSQMAGTPLGSKTPVHPNDHANLGQSSNDVFPTAIHVAAGEALKTGLLPALELLQSALQSKAEAFNDVLKIGRTHLMDATPVRLGQEFAGYAAQLAHSSRRGAQALEALLELPLGGSAVGTGLNTDPRFAAIAIEELRKSTGIHWREAQNHFEAQSAKDAIVETSGLLKTVATSLFKIANDIRWLGSGPRCGLGELRLPATQPGSSIMPGKVNPVICESVMQVCARVFGDDATVTWAAANGNLELNTMMPVMADALLDSIQLLTNVTELFRLKCIEGLEANRARCESLVESSMAMVTSLAPIIGYDRAATIAKESDATGKTIRQICLEKQILPDDDLARILDARRMTGPDPGQ